MATSVHKHLDELQSLLRQAIGCARNLAAYDGAGKHDAWCSLSENATLHDYLKRATKEADKLTEHFRNQMKRQAL
jgi:hypothetical protein